MCVLGHQESEKDVEASNVISDNRVLTLFCFLKTMCVLGHQESEKDVEASNVISDNRVLTLFCFLKTMCVLGHQESEKDGELFTDCHRQTPKPVV